MHFAILSGGVLLADTHPFANDAGQAPIRRIASASVDVKEVIDPPSYWHNHSLSLPLSSITLVLYSKTGTWNKFLLSPAMFFFCNTISLIALSPEYGKLL